MGIDGRIKRDNTKINFDEVFTEPSVSPESREE